MSTPIETNTASLQQLLTAVQNLPKAGNDVIMQNITLTASGWTEDTANSQFTQTITSSAITANTLVDLYPDAAIMRQLANDGVTAIFARNDAGTVSVVALDAKPTIDLTMQACFVAVGTGE